MKKLRSHRVIKKAVSEIKTIRKNIGNANNWFNKNCF